MTPEQTLERIRAAGLRAIVRGSYFFIKIEDLGRLLDAERNQTWTQQHWTNYEEAIVAAEREAVLDLVDAYAKNNTDLADAIRARGQQ